MTLSPPIRWYLGAAALLLAQACTNAPVTKPKITRGDPVANVVMVRFESAQSGLGQVRVTTEGVTRVIESDGQVGTEHTVALWLPSGLSSEVWAEVVTDRGKVLQSARNKVRMAAAPKAARWTLNRVDEARSEVAKGVILVNTYDNRQSHAVVLDGKANVLWWVAEEAKTQDYLRLRPGRDDRSIIVSRWRSRFTGKGDDGLITRYNLDDTQSRTDTRALDLHHDWIETPDGRFVWISWSRDEARAVDGLGVIPVAADRLLVADEGAVEGEEEVLYDLLRDYPEDVWYPCGHMEPGGFAGRKWWEWSHANSMDYDEDQDAVRILNRYWNAVLQIGLDGELDWQAGGRYSDFAVSDWMRHGHASDLAGDQMIIFNNGDHGPAPIISDVRAFDIDYDTMSITEAWSFPDPRGEFSTFLGDARLLPGGNVLVLFSDWGLMQEFTQSGEVVWEAQHNTPTVAGRITFSTTLRPH